MRTVNEVISEMKRNNVDPQTIDKEIDELEKELFLFLMEEAYGDGASGAV